MARGSKSSYTNKQKRQAEHIEDSYEDRGVSHEEAEARAWATVNKSTGGGKKSGSGRKRATKKSAAKKGGRKSAAKKGGRKSTAKKAGRKSTRKRATAKKSTRKRATAKKTTRKRTTAKKTTRKRAKR